MDRMVIQHTTNNNRTPSAAQRQPAAALSTPQNAGSVASTNQPQQAGQFVDQFSEISDFVRQLYKELVAQNKPHSFNDFSCIFCEAAYFHLDHLIEHLEQVHRHQVQNGTFQLQANFEEVIRARILQGNIGYQQQQQQNHLKMESIPQAGPGQVYQCAKCFGTFAHMDEVSTHLAQCAMTYNYQQQQPNHQQQPHLGDQSAAHPQQHHQQNQQHQQQQMNYNKSHQMNNQQMAATAGAAQQQSHYAQSHQQPQQQQQPSHQHLVPVIETPTTVPIRHEIYGCARCGLRFRVVRELVMHLHMCVVDTFRDKAHYLTPDLWLQAPEGQHIVINEPESNTTLNTTGLWLMSNDVVSSPDIVSKGFWVMPPNNASAEVASTSNNSVKAEASQTPASIPSPAVIPQSLDEVSVDVPYIDYNQVVQQQPNAAKIVQQQLLQTNDGVQNSEPVAWKKQTTSRKPKTPADENKRKRSRAKPKVQPPVIETTQYEVLPQTGSMIASPLQQQQAQSIPNKYTYTNGDLTIAAVEHTNHVHTPPPTKRKRYEQQQQQTLNVVPQTDQIVQEFLQGNSDNNELIELVEPSTHNYILNTYDTSHQQSHVIATQTQSQPQHQQQPQPQTQHIITKDGLLYEQLDYAFPSDSEPIKIQSSYIIDHPAGSVSQTATTPQSSAAPQQHFKKKMQQQARSTTMLPKQQTVPPQEILQSPQCTSNQGKTAATEPPPQILAIIANPEDLEDLSHLDKPIVVPMKTMPLKAKHTDYIESYCSFLKNRTHK